MKWLNINQQHELQIDKPLRKKLQKSLGLRLDTPNYLGVAFCGVTSYQNQLFLLGVDRSVIDLGRAYTSQATVWTLKSLIRDEYAARQEGFVLYSGKGPHVWAHEVPAACAWAKDRGHLIHVGPDTPDNAGWELPKHD